MENVKKVTKRMVYGEMAKIFADMERQDLVDFVNHEIELIEKKSSKSGMTATQKENEGIIELIFTALDKIDTPVTISELQAQNAEIGQYSNQKISALMKKLVDAGRVIKTTEKKKSYFSKVIKRHFIAD